MHSNYNRTGLQSEKDQNFGSDYFLCFIQLTRESSHLKKNKNRLPARTYAGRANTLQHKRGDLCAKRSSFPLVRRKGELRETGNRLRSTKRPVSLRGWRQNRPGRFYKGRLRFRTKLSPRTLRFPRRIRWACLNKPAQKSV